MGKISRLFTKFLIMTISLCLVLFTANPAIEANTGESRENESDTITVCVSMEKFTLGQGYIIEPTLVKVKEGTLASVVITDLLKARYPDIPQPWRMTGNLDNSFYLSAAYDPDRGTPSVPQFILDHAKIDVDRSTGDWLGEFDYYSMSGWMYSVNGKFPNVGAAAWPMKDGEVMRWQFTLYGYGADLGADNREWGTPDITDVGNKDDLTWEVAKYNAMYDKSLLTKNENYVNAMAVLQDLEVPQEEVSAALAALEEDGPRFFDVPKNAWYKDAVEHVLESELFKGTSSTTFSPESTLNRGMVITVLHRLAGEPKVEVTDSAIFPDVSIDDWYGSAAAWAAKEGITVGLVSDGKLEPERIITREQLADLMYRYTKISKSEVTKGDLSNFVDQTEVSPVFREAVTWAVGEGLLKGTDGVSLAPREELTRSQFATMIMRFLK